MISRYLDDRPTSFIRADATDIRSMTKLYVCVGRPGYRKQLLVELGRAKQIRDQNGAAVLNGMIPRRAQHYMGAVINERFNGDPSVDKRPSALNVGFYEHLAGCCSSKDVGVLS